MLERVTDRAILWALLVLHLVGSLAIVWLVLTLNAAVERQRLNRDETLSRLELLGDRVDRIEKTLIQPAQPAQGGR